MKYKKYLNSRQLTVKQVKVLVETEGLLRADYAELFKETDATGDVTRDDLVYELPGERILYVYGPTDTLRRGQGNIYALDAFLRVLLHKRVYPHGQGDSESVWRAHSRLQSALVLHLPALEAELARCLLIAPERLDHSYASLDAVSKACEAYGLQSCLALYDHLVAYVGAVILQRVQGKWGHNTTWGGGDYPFISIGDDNRVQYMVINVVWNALSGLQPIDFRSCTLAEVRANSRYAALVRAQTKRQGTL